MSAREAIGAALAGALRGAEGLGGWAVFDAAPVRGAVPYAVVEEPQLADWSTKDWQGREARCVVTLNDAGERPVRLRGACGAAEEAVAALADDLGGGWRLAGLLLLRSRLDRAGADRWRGTIEWRLRIRNEGRYVMTERGSAFLLKVGDGGSPPAFATVAGLRTTQLSVNGEAVVVTSKDSGGWRDLLSGAGTRSVSVSGAGVFSGSAAEARLQASVLAGTLDDYRLAFESGASMTGRFLVTRLDYAGDYNGERSYTLTLESSGPVVVA